MQRPRGKAEDSEENFTGQEGGGGGPAARPSGKTNEFYLSAIGLLERLVYRVRRNRDVESAAADGSDIEDAAAGRNKTPDGQDLTFGDGESQHCLAFSGKLWRDLDEEKEGSEQAHADGDSSPGESPRTSWQGGGRGVEEAIEDQCFAEHNDKNDGTGEGGLTETRWRRPADEPVSSVQIIRSYSTSVLGSGDASAVAAARKRRMTLATIHNATLPKYVGREECLCFPPSLWESDGGNLAREANGVFGHHSGHREARRGDVEYEDEGEEECGACPSPPALVDVTVAQGTEKGGIHEKAAAKDSFNEPVAARHEVWMSQWGQHGRDEIIITPCGQIEAKTEWAAIGDMNYFRNRFHKSGGSQPQLSSLSLGPSVSETASSIASDARRKRMAESARRRSLCLSGSERLGAESSFNYWKQNAASSPTNAAKRGFGYVPRRKEPEISPIRTREAIQASQTSSLRRRRWQTTLEEDKENPIKKSCFTQNGQLTQSCKGNANPVKEPAAAAENTAPVKEPAVATPSPPAPPTIDVAEDETDPLDFIEVKSAAQWKAVSGRISWKFDDDHAKKEEEAQSKNKRPPRKIPTIKRTPSKVNFSIRPGSAAGAASQGTFKPTRVQQLRLVCWKVKPWKQPASHHSARLFSTQFAAAWGVDCDEVHPGLFIGDKKAAGHVAFLRHIGVTHVLNAAEGKDEGLVDLSQEHYGDSGIKYLGFPLWDTSTCNILPYLGCAADFIASAIGSGGKCLVNCQMGVSRSSTCAMAYLMTKKGMTAVEVLTQFRQHRDVRPNDGFLEQLVELDNDFRRNREMDSPLGITLSTLDDFGSLPQPWNHEFWTKPMTEEEVGMPLVNFGEPNPLTDSVQDSERTSLQTSKFSSRLTSRRSSRKSLASRRSSTRSSKSISRHSSFKTPARGLKPACNNQQNPFLDEDKENGSLLTVEKLEQVKGIIQEPEEQWRILWTRNRNSGQEEAPSRSSLTSSLKSSVASSGGGRSTSLRTRLRARSSTPNPIQPGLDDGDLLSMLKVSSAKQWKAISQKLSINLDDINLEGSEGDEDIADGQPSTLVDFQPTTVEKLRLAFWKIKPDIDSRIAIADGWKVSCDEVFPNVLVGDEASARNLGFLAAVGVTHVLNAAEGSWKEFSCVDLSPGFYKGTSITYLGMEIWDNKAVNLSPFLHCANYFINAAVQQGSKCLVSGHDGVSRSVVCAMAYVMMTHGWDAAEVMNAFRKRRDVRPSDGLLAHIAELDNRLRKNRIKGKKQTAGVGRWENVDCLPKPWHFEYWRETPDPKSIPFDLCHQKDHAKEEESKAIDRKEQRAESDAMSQGSVCSDSSDWEWEYYSSSSDEEDEEDDRVRIQYEHDLGLNERIERRSSPKRDIRDFVPTLEKHMRLICWKVKPWTEAKTGKRLFSSHFAAMKDVDCDEVYPRLYIGDAASAKSIKFLQDQGITHVLNTAEGKEEGLVNLSAEHYAGTGVSYLGFRMEDAPWFDVTPYIDHAVKFITEALDSPGGQCLVNCQMGVSRSSTCALAYMMKTLGYSAVDALRQFRSYRDVRPNDGFIKYLVQLDNQLRMSREGFA